MRPLIQPQAIRTVSASRNADASAITRFQIFRQTREGTYASAFKSNSAVEAVGAFLRQSPSFEGGEIRLWDNREQHLSAWVKWTTNGADIDTSTYSRENVFQDRLLAIIARHVESLEKMGEDVRRGVRVSV